MKFSVCVAAYKADETILDALESVSRQLENDWGIIVVEDGPGVDTHDIVTRFSKTVPNPVIYDQLPRQSGVAAVRNRLLEIASGESIAFLDADDLWQPNHLANIANRLAPEISICVTPIEIRELKSGRCLGNYRPLQTLESNPVATLFDQSAIMTSSSIAFRSTVKDSVGLFDTQLRIGEDRDYWLRAAIAGFKFGITESASVVYHKHPGSAMSATLRVAEDEVTFYQKYKNIESIRPRQRKRKLSNALWNFARLLRQKNPAKARQLALRAVMLYPYSCPKYLWSLVND